MTEPLFLVTDADCESQNSGSKLIIREKQLFPIPFNRFAADNSKLVITLINVIEYITTNKHE
jgi:hypothetical protein